MSAVVFLSGSTMGDALGSAGRSFRNTFEHLGYQFVEINFVKPDAHDLLNRTIKEVPIEFAFSFVGMGADFQGTRSDGQAMNLWEAIGVPFISLYGDTPAYFFDRHVMPGDLFASLYAFPEHFHLRKRLPKLRGLVGVCPHAPLEAIAKDAIDFSRKEKGALLFLKNGNSPDQLLAAWREALSETMFSMMTDLASELAGQLHTDLGNNIDAVVCDYFHDKGLDIEALTNLRLFFIAQLDDYLRRLKSTFIAEVLLDFPIEVHGYNWEHVDFSGKRATLVPSADYSKSKLLIKESLGLLDMSPNTGLAPHDRPMRAYGMFTLCLTNEQEYFKRHFEQHHAFSFRFEKESLQTKVADVLAHPRRYIEIAIEVAEEFRKKNPSDSSAQLMLDTASSVRLACAPGFPNLPPYFAWPPAKLP